MPDHLGFIISTLGKGALRVPERRCFALCRQARAAFRGSQESSPRRLRPPSSVHGGCHLMLAGSQETGSLSSHRSLQHARAVQDEIVPASSNRRQLALLAQLRAQERTEPPRAIARSTFYLTLHRRIGHHWLGLGVGHPTSQRDRVQDGGRRKKCWK